MGIGIGNCFRAHRCLKGLLYETIFSQNQHWAFPEELELVNKVFKSLLRQKSEWKWETKEQRKNGTQQRHRNNNKNGAYERNWYKEKAKIFEIESFPWHTRCDVDAVLDVSSERKYKNISYKNTRNINPWWFFAGGAVVTTVGSWLGGRRFNASSCQLPF